jgi:hypothetical protein
LLNIRGKTGEGKLRLACEKRANFKRGVAGEKR